jgi:tetratricopeptide (TPR) repeat protein
LAKTIIYKNLTKNLKKMKTKLNLILFTLTTFVLVFVITKITDRELEVIPKTAVKIVKCSSANFLLKDVDTTQQIAPLFEDLGKHYYTITTSSTEAQIFFNQGLNLTYAFNHAEAHRSFMEASRLDPNSAMTYWGQAYVLGPNINDQFPDKERRNKSYEAIQRAKRLASKSTNKEQALINALAFRYSKDSVDIAQLNLDYMNEMAKVLKQFPNDAEVQTLYAAAVMNTVPWNYWDNEGNPSPNVVGAKAALEKAMEINIDHPGANHYYIHMVELPKPDLGVPSADRLFGLMAGAGHLVHMPGHIYMRVGRYEDAVKVNVAAILADEDYISQCYAQGLYPLGYYPHNIHFLWSAASMLGNSEIAIDAAKKTAEKIPLSELEELPFLQTFAVTPILAYTRFGKWNEILTIPYPGDEYTEMKFYWHYARGIAFLRKNNLKEAQEELNSLAERDIKSNHEKKAKVAYEVLAGEIESAKGNLDLAIEHLEKAVIFEDELAYNEPAEWYIPTRQSLGAVLLKAKKYEDAEIIFIEDLEYYRDNGWSLMGLYQSLSGQGQEERANEVKLKFDEAWSRSDIEISTSVL